MSKILANFTDTGSETFFRYQVFPMLVPRLFPVPIFLDTGSETLSGTNFFRYRFRYHQKNEKNPGTGNSRYPNVILWSTCIHFDPHASNFVHLHPPKSTFIHFCPPASTWVNLRSHVSTSVHLRPPVCTCVYLHPPSSICIHFCPPAYHASNYIYFCPHASGYLVIWSYQRCLLAIFANV